MSRADLLKNRCILKIGCNSKNECSFKSNASKNKSLNIFKNIRTASSKKHSKLRKKKLNLSSTIDLFQNEASTSKSSYKSGCNTVKNSQRK